MRTDKKATIHDTDPIFLMLHILTGTMKLTMNATAKIITAAVGDVGQTKLTNQRKYKYISEIENHFKSHFSDNIIDYRGGVDDL